MPTVILEKTAKTGQQKITFYRPGGYGCILAMIYDGSGRDPYRTSAPVALSAPRGEVTHYTTLSSGKTVGLTAAEAAALVTGAAAPVVQAARPARRTCTDCQGPLTRSGECRECGYQY